MNGRELESGGHHYPKDFRRRLTPECSVTYSPSLESQIGMEIPGRRNFLVNEWSGTRIGRSPLPQRFPPQAYPRMLSHLQPFPRISPRVPPRRHATVKSKVYVTPHGAFHRTRAASELGL